MVATAKQVLASTFVCLSVVTLWAGGCEPIQPMQPIQVGASVQLPTWEGPAQEIFDDSIDPAAVGLTMEGAVPAADVLLRARAQKAALVARVKVNTVTVDTVGDEITYHLGIEVITAPLAHPKIQDQRFELLIRPTGRASATVKAFDARLRGTTFVAFLSRFASAETDSEIHWHLSADAPDVIAAVKDAVVLAELSGTGR